jgi:hypothetical protein
VEIFPLFLFSWYQFLKCLDEGCDIYLKHLSNLDEFNQVQPPLGILILGNIGLRTAQTVGKFTLGKSSRFAGLKQKLSKVLVGRTESRFGHDRAS